MTIFFSYTHQFIKYAIIASIMEKKNKKYLLIALVFSACLFFAGCAQHKAPEGNWETAALIKEGYEQDVMKSNIEFLQQDKTLRLKGCAGINLYRAKAKVKGKSFNAFDMENTGFMGKISEMEFEDMFFDVLMNSDSYKIKDDTLYIYASSRNMELQLKRK